MFDFDAAFREFFGRFKNPGKELEARMYWDRLVNASDGDETAAKCHEELLGGLIARATAEWSAAYTLRKLFGARLPSAEVPKAVTAKPTEVATIAVSDSYSAFRDTWARWPKDPTRVAELEVTAKYAWDRAVARHGLDATVAASAYYTRKSRGLAHPLNLSTWLEDGDVAFYAAEQRKQPTEADRAEFEAAYRKYPRPALDEEEAFDLYAARIAKEDRLAFLAAVVEYAADRAGKEPKYIKKWSTFVAGEWRERDAVSVLWGAIRCAARIEEHEATITSYDDGHGWRRRIWVPDGSLPEAIAELIEGVNRARVEGYHLAIDGDAYHPDPITKTAAEVLDAACQLLATPPRVIEDAPLPFEA